jgi:hypothetical protein
MSFQKRNASYADMRAAELGGLNGMNLAEIALNLTPEQQQELEIAKSAYTTTRRRGGSHHKKKSHHRKSHHRKSHKKSHQ